MKAYWQELLAVSAIMIVLPTGSIFAQKSLPKVPITYAGDTDQTITRRAQWIEGAKKEGALTWWGSRTPNEAKDILAEFNKIYPFIKVTYWRGKGEEVGSKLEAEYTSGRYTCDVALGGEHPNYPRWRKMGMLARFADFIPNMGKIDKRIYGKNGDYMMTGSTVILPTYNTKLVSAAEAPKTWDDLLSPRWKGMMGMTTDVKVWVFLALAEGGWGVEKTEAFLKKLRDQNPIWAPSHTTAHTLLGAGEFMINAEGYLHHIARTHGEGPPVNFCKVNPLAIEGSAITLQAHAPHPNAARLFVEWLFSPQGFSVIEKVTGKGEAFPGAGTIQAKAIAGLELAVATEEIYLEAISLNLYKRFTAALGAAP